MKKISSVVLLLFYAGWLIAQINLDSNLLAHLPLDGNGADASGNNNHASVSANGAYGTSDRLSNPNAAMLFNGTLENGILDFGVPLLNNRNTFSISFWFNPSSLTNNMSLVGQDNILEIGFYTGATRIVVYHPTSASVNVNLAQGAGVWQHFAVTTSPTQMKIYLNGALVNTLNGNYTLGNNTTTTRIGGNVVNSSNNTWFRGSIDEVRFYTRELTQDEINFLSGSLSLTYVIGNLASTAFCAGSSFSIPFTVIGANIDSANIFTAQLSDGHGNFSHATSIGSLQTFTAGTIAAKIPANIPNGSGYKLRIISSLPQAAGPVSTETFTIQNTSDAFSTLSRDRMLWLQFNTNTADSSALGNHAISVGGTSYTTDRFGNATGAIQLNGTNGHVDVPDGVWFNETFAVSAWIRPQAYATWSRIFDFGNGQQNDNVVFVLSNGTSGNLFCDVRLGTGASNPLSTAASAPLNVWSHVVLQHDGTEARIYLNGALVGAAVIPAPRFVSRVNNYIGRSNWATDAYANCAFDDFMLFNRTLSEDEIDMLANDGILFSNNTPCSGNFLQLSAPAIPNAAYNWSGPNGFSSNQRQPAIPNAATTNSGTYSLTITQPGCSAFSQSKSITVVNAANQPVVVFSGLPAVTNLQAAANTLTGTPSGGYFSGNGMEVNVFNPLVAGTGTHTILYNVRHSSGCLTTFADTVIVHDSYVMQNGTTTACNGGFYDSGGSSGSYAANENYTQTFCSDNGERLKFRFTSMSIGTGDTLWAFDGNSVNANLLGTYIPDSRPDVIWSTGTCITFRFRSNASAQTTGWISSFECSQNPEEVKSISLSAGINVTCNAEIRDPAGTGNYGYGYNVQTFKSYNGGRLRLDFFEFNINFNNGGHWLIIYDGPSTAYPRIGSYNSCCAPPTIIESTGEYLTLVFDANNTNAGVGSRQGFGATLSCFSAPLPVYNMNDTLVTACQGVFYDDKGPDLNFSANQYHKQTFCSGNGEHLQFNFNPFETGFDSGDTLWAYDGADTTSRLLGYYIQGSTIERLTSTGTCLSFRFTSNASTEAGWQASLKCINIAAARDTINMSSGVRATCNAIIRDPAGTGNYGFGYNTQTLKSYDGSRLRLDFYEFNINFNNGGHWLNIYDGPSTAYPRIGSYNSCCDPPTIIESSGEYLTLVFDANNTNAGVGTRQGFAATVSCFGVPLPVFTMQDTSVNICEAVFYDDAGPAANYTHNYSATHTFCSGNGQMLQVTFNVHNTQFGTGDTLWAYDGPGINAPALGTYIPGSRIEPLTSTGTCVTFRFKSNSASNGRGWQGFVKCVNTPPAQITYIISSGIRNICTGKLSDPGGSGNYGVGSGETYIQTFTSYSGQQVRATRNSFSVNGNNGGHWLDVYDGTSIAAPLIGSYNNFNFPPQAFQSTGSSLTFRFRATNTSAAGNAGYDFTISCFTGSPIDVDWLYSPVCQGGGISVPFTLNDSVNANNVYTAQLSDSLGNFNSALNIGTLASTASSGTISATIPPGVFAGSGYRIRVNSSQPVQLGSQSPNPITVIKTPVQPNNISVNGPANFCSGIGTATLSVANQAGISYRWLLNDTVTVGANSNSFTATQAGVYKVELSSACDTIISNASVTINSIAAPVAATIIANGPTSFCSSGSVVLSIPAQAGMNYQWKRSAINVGTNSNTYTASVAGDYTVIVNNTCGSAASSNMIQVSITGSAPTAPSIAVNGATNFCTGASVTLSIPAQAGAAYQWKQGTSTVGTNSESYVATQSGVYTVVLTNGCGNATSANSITVTVNSGPIAPTISANGLTTFCTGGSIQLSVPGQNGVTYQWKEGANNVGTNSNTYTATQAGTYTVELTNNCGSVVSSNSIMVTVTGAAPGAPTISAGGATAFCSGDDVELSIPVQSGVTYQWKNGANNVGSNSNTYTATQAGAYTVIVTNGCGSANSVNSVTVTISGSAPTVPAITTNGPSAICTSGSVELSVPTQTSVTYQWREGSNNVGTNSNTYTATQAGTYTVELTNNCGSVVSSNSITVTITNGAPAAPVITANGTTTFCAGGNVELSVPVQSGVNYQWKNGTNNTGTNSNTYTATEAGVYAVELSNGCGSAASTNSITVTVNQGSSIQLAETICAGESYLFDEQSLNTGGQYSATLSNAAGCDSVVTLTLTVRNASTSTLTESDHCGAYSFNGQTLTTSGTYRDTLSAASGCDSIVILLFTYNPTPVPVITQTAFSLETSFGFAEYQWYLNGVEILAAIGPVYVPLQPGVYTVEVTGSNGCSGTSADFNFNTVGAGIAKDSLQIAVFPNPAHDMLFIVTDHEGELEAELITADGRKLFVHSLTSFLQIDISSLASGYHVLRIFKDGRNILNREIMIENH